MNILKRLLFKTKVWAFQDFLFIRKEKKSNRRRLKLYNDAVNDLLGDKSIDEKERAERISELNKFLNYVHFSDDLLKQSEFDAQKDKEFRELLKRF